LTAWINDESWENSYLEWLKSSNFNANDAILVLSVGGGTEKVSKNLVVCMQYAVQINAKIFAIVSRDGGKAKELSDVCVLVPVVNSQRITPHSESWQVILLHLIVNSLVELKKAENPN